MTDIQVYERLASLEAKIDTLLQNITRRDDNEKEQDARIKALEQKLWISYGGLVVLAFLIRHVVFR